MAFSGRTYYLKAMQRGIWKPSFTSWPRWPCPSCKVGTLRLDRKTIQRKETRSSKNDHSQSDWDPTWIRERFVAILDCANPSCKESVSVCGQATEDWEPIYTDDGGIETGLADWYAPQFFEPALPVFPIPRQCPKTVAVELRKAFGQIWSDVGSAGNRLRVAVEALLNERGIQKKAKVKAGRRGKFRLLTLHERIEKFAATHEDAGTQLMAIKWLGNVGSHAAMDVLTRDDVLDAFEHFEYALDLIYVTKGAELARRAKNIVRKKGPVRKKPVKRRSR